ncbi:MAG: hypothetical protein ACPGVJ_07170, partial [Mangrovicoccus sp.]
MRCSLSPPWSAYPSLQKENQNRKQIKNWNDISFFGMLVSTMIRHSEEERMGDITLDQVSSAYDV